MGQLQVEDPRIVEGIIKSGRCARVGKEFLDRVARKDGGMAVKLPCVDC